MGYPNNRRFLDNPPTAFLGVLMQFPLVYEGRLKSASSSSRSHKHDIRLRFATQLRRLWSQEPLASSAARDAGRDRHYGLIIDGGRAFRLR